MQQFIIGRGGTQPFPISEARTRVSSKHARLTITDEGTWILEDLNSRNGTYIIDKDGELCKIKSMVIEEFTRIILADQTKMGYTFLAHHVLEKDPKDYRKEFRYLLDVHAKALREKAAIDQKVQKKSYLKYLPSALSALFGLLVTASLPSDIKPYSFSITAAITTVLTIVVNNVSSKNNDLKHFNSYYSKILVCPSCGKPLSEPEFKNQMCGACKAHA